MVFDQWRSMNKKILIVDDLAENLHLYSLFVKSRFPDVEIVTTTDSKETFELVERERPDLVMLDAMMPEMDGFEVCAKLKADERTSSTLVLMVSAVLVDSKNRTTGLNVGADGYLCKPFEQQELAAQIKAFFRIRDTEIALEKARRRAELATKTKSRFLAQMSHEIRTPMNAVIGMTDIILGTELDSNQREMAETIKQSGESLLRIINDILDFSKIESGRLEMHRKEFTLSDCVDAVIRLLAYNAQSKEIELAYWVDPELPECVYSDYERLRQVLVNLAGNAVKFTEEGEVVIRVELDSDEQDDEIVNIRFSVRDTGIGISKKDQKLLGQPFTQVDPSNTRKFHGTGLGLAISRRIIEMLGGEMQVDSEPGVGSTFSFVLPLKTTPSITGTDDREIRKVLAGKHALVVDDTDVNRQILRNHLNEWGVLIEEAACAEEAIGILSGSRKFDLFLLDMHMPGQNGLELARQIRSIDSFDDTPILMLTSIGRGEEAGIMRKHGVDDCLQKPIRPEQLKKAIGNFFTKGARQEETDNSVPISSDLKQMAKEYPFRILLAEDNIVNQKVATQMASGLGYDIDCVENGALAVERIKKQDYDVVFMDMQMPEMDGWEATERIRTVLSKDRQPYIIAMTAGAMYEDRKKCFEAGLDAFVPKPIRLEELVGALKAAKAGERYGENPGD